MNKKQQIVQKENVVQAVLIVDDFDEAFVPISNDVPLVDCLAFVAVNIYYQFYILGTISINQ